MRAYFFGNMYLSSIQQGIQSGHVIADMFVKYFETSKFGYVPQLEFLIKWADEHKTMILLNAGYASEIHDLGSFLIDNANSFPWASFSESTEALDGAATSIGIILPEKIYNTSGYIRSLSPDDRDMTLRLMYLNNQIEVPATKTTKLVIYNLTNFEIDLVQKLNNYGLAK